MQHATHASRLAWSSSNGQDLAACSRAGDGKTRIFADLLRLAYALCLLRFLLWQPLVALNLR